ncbi:MAG: 5-formyltetrahydrofolate cyclo-ligase [Bacilli bacterium]
MNKKFLRKKYLSIRKHSSDADLAVQKNLLELLKGYKSVALYYAINEEISLNDLFLHLSNRMDLFLPYTNEELEFRKFNSFDTLLPDKAKIMAPQGENYLVNDIEVIVMACIACSYSGYRLGYGAGYYDRALQDYKGLKIGIVYDECITTNDFHNEYDVRLDYIITETKIIKVKE